MITLRSAESFQLPLQLRMPFRYGIVTLTHITQQFLRLQFEIDGRVETGFAADNLAPKWFKKDPKQSLEDDVAEINRVVRAAVSHARAIRARTAFEFWRELYAAQAAWAKTQPNVPPLLAHFGTSLIERALLSALCRLRALTTSELLRGDLTGMDVGALQPSLAGSSAGDGLPATPVANVFARHTVGLSDPLDASDLADGDRLDDGLPQTLVECIRFYGLRHFKLKINGNGPADRDRLLRVAKVIAAECDDYAFSIDGNESFRDVASFADFVRELLAVPELRAWWPHLLFFEQPWHRDVALAPAMEALARNWPDRPPVIIDESDAEIDSVRTALELGYAGTSHKNCKGIFKSVANACLLAQRRAAGAKVVLSGEDLTNLGPVALMQDLALQAALGVTSVERNGQHYFRGLAQFPPKLQHHALAHHGDLFTHTPAGWPRLDIRHGRIALGSVNAAPFGLAGEPDLSELPREEW